MRCALSGSIHRMLEVSAIPAFSDNYIWLIHAPMDRRQVVAVDPGQTEPVLAALKEQSLELAGIFATHHHFDHTGGIAGLREAFDVPVFGPARESVPQCSFALGQDEVAALPHIGLSFKVLDIPGHTAGHIAFAGHGAVFCGDTLFSAGCGRLFEGTPRQMLDSLDRLCTLPDDTAIYCGHEYTLANLRFALAVDPDNPEALDYRSRCEALRARSEPTLPSSMALEKTVNPFLRCRAPVIRKRVANHAGRELQDEVEVFAELRAWKDNF